MPEYTERQEDLKQRFIEARGYWHEHWDNLLTLDPDYFEGYLNFSSPPWTNGPLEPKVKELLYISLNANATHLFAPGIRVHMQNALALGATKEEIMEVFEIVSVVGIHTMSVGLPILIDELAKQESRNGAEATT
jgi:alkylhydroperoxidase/carboxymuconolactone decarboxylase family protein YurZ